MRIVLYSKEGYMSVIEWNGVNKYWDMQASKPVKAPNDLPNNENKSCKSLPLLFTHGMPKILEDFTEEELECFIPYLNECSATIEGRHIWSRPLWWLADLGYSPTCPPIAYGPQRERRMKELVISCYKYHKSMKLIRVSANLASLPRVFLRFDQLPNRFVLIKNRRTNMTYWCIHLNNLLYDYGIHKQSGTCSYFAQEKTELVKLSRSEYGECSQFDQEEAEVSEFDSNKLGHPSQLDNDKTELVEVSSGEDSSEECTIVYEGQPPRLPIIHKASNLTMRKLAGKSSKKTNDENEVIVIDDDTPIDEGRLPERLPQPSRFYNKFRFFRKLGLYPNRNRSGRSGGQRSIGKWKGRSINKITRLFEVSQIAESNLMEDMKVRVSEEQQLKIMSKVEANCSTDKAFVEHNIDTFNRMCPTKRGLYLEDVEVGPMKLRCGKDLMRPCAVVLEKLTSTEVRKYSCPARCGRKKQTKTTRSTKS